jgi:hypothetical protein
MKLSHVCTRLLGLMYYLWIGFYRFPLSLAIHPSRLTVDGFWRTRESSQTRPHRFSRHTNSRKLSKCYNQIDEAPVRLHITSYMERNHIKRVAIRVGVGVPAAYENPSPSKANSHFHSYHHNSTTHCIEHRLSVTHQS